MSVIYVDTETMGFTSPLLSIQYGFEDGRSFFHNVWTSEVDTTLSLIEKLCQHKLVAWNFVFDSFQINKWYNILRAYRQVHGNDIDVWKLHDIEAQHPADWCVKPVSAVDLMLHARKGPFQHLMNLKPIKIRAVPELYATSLIELIEKNLKLPKGSKVKMRVTKNDKRPGTADIKVKFIGSTSLKYVHEVVTGEPKYGSWGDFYQTVEYATPYKPWGGNWQGEALRIQSHGFTPEQRAYALKDIRMLDDLYRYFGRPEPTVDDELTWCVGATRWKGYSVDFVELQKAWRSRNKDVPMAYNHVKPWLEKRMDEMELLMLTDTKKETLRSIAKLDAPCSKFAQMVLDERQNYDKRNIIKKLKEANGFYPELKVVGTLTNRMSGGGMDKAGASVNPQGISKSPEIRRAFTFAFEDEMFSGGDFKAFEISIMDAVWGDPELHKELLMGKKMIALFGARIYGKAYEEVLKSDKEGEGSMYDRAKKGFYARAYGGQAKKLSEVFGLSVDETVAKLNYFDTSYANISKHNTEVADKFRMLVSWVWVDPAPYTETILGYRRYFTLEQSFAKSVYNAIRQIPETWTQPVRRKDRWQTAAQAASSALFGSIKQLEARIIRVAGNCEIQSPGAELNKMLQADIWKLQPSGIAQWLVRPMNVHDEQCVAHNPEMQGVIKNTVDAFVQRMRSKVPLLAVDWKSNIKSWEDK